MRQIGENCCVIKLCIEASGVEERAARLHFLRQHNPVRREPTINSSIAARCECKLIFSLRIININRTEKSTDTVDLITLSSAWRELPSANGRLKCIVCANQTSKHVITVKVSILLPSMSISVAIESINFTSSSCLPILRSLFALFASLNYTIRNLVITEFSLVFCVFQFLG